MPTVNNASSAQKAVDIQEQTNIALVKTIRDNFNSQYASQASSLAVFRDVVSTHGGTEVDDATLLADFRAHVPLSIYESYRPFMDKFNAQPCKEEDVVNMFSPGLPDYLALSSATSGSTPKMLPKYNHDNTRPPYYTYSKDPIAALVCTGYRDVKVIERVPGEVVRRIPVCIGSGGYVRRSLGWYIDDESQLSATMPGAAAPWAATVIGYFPSFLAIHGLFFLAHRNVCHFRTIFAVQFVDLIRCIDEHWDMLVSCIRDGTVPDLKGIEDVRKHLEDHLHSDPERAAELLDIGPPFSSEGWFAHVWPKVNCLVVICSGPFATVLPKVRSILGPNVAIRCPGYASSEAMLGVPFDVDKLDEFVLKSDSVVEFLDVSLDATHENVCQAWEVQAGKYYEPILTTRDGLWRYRLGDILHITGFNAGSQCPQFTVAGRRSMVIHFSFGSVGDEHLLAAIQALSLSAEGVIRVQEFTAVLDERASLPTVGFFVELSEPLGPNARAAPQALFDALVAHKSELQLALDSGKMRLPTVRIVKAGTFTEYRQWKGERMSIVSGQIKVPVVLLDPTAQEWVSDKAVQEL